MTTSGCHTIGHAVSGAAWRHLPMRRVQELGDLAPVHDAIEWKREPTSVAVVGRDDEPRILTKRISFGRIAEEVQRLARRRPAWARRRVDPVEDRESPPTDSKERPPLELSLVCTVEGEADAADSLQEFVICRTDHHLLDRAIGALSAALPHGPRRGSPDGESGRHERAVGVTL